MKTIARRRATAPLALAAALLTAFLVLLSPLSASAHDKLTASSPEADATVQTLPGELTLSFSADLIDSAGATEVVVTDPSGASVVDGAPVVAGPVVTLPLSAEGTAGAYQVIWRVVSSDGHPISGEFSFTVSESSAVLPAETPTPTVSADAEAEASPEATPAATPVSTTTAEDQDTAAPVSGWLIGLSIVGVLAGATVILLTWRRSRGAAAESASDAPTDH